MNEASDTNRAANVGLSGPQILERFFQKAQATRDPEQRKQYAQIALEARRKGLSVILDEPETKKRAPDALKLEGVRQKSEEYPERENELLNRRAAKVESSITEIGFDPEKDKLYPEVSVERESLRNNKAKLNRVIARRKRLISLVNQSGRVDQRSVPGSSVDPSSDRMARRHAMIDRLSGVIKNLTATVILQELETPTRNEGDPLAYSNNSDSSLLEWCEQTDGIAAESVQGEIIGRLNNEPDFGGRVLLLLMLRNIDIKTILPNFKQETIRAAVDLPLTILFPSPPASLGQKADASKKILQDFLNTAAAPEGKMEVTTPEEDPIKGAYMDRNEELLQGRLPNANTLSDVYQTNELSVQQALRVLAADFETGEEAWESGINVSTYTLLLIGKSRIEINDEELRQIPSKIIAQAIGTDFQSYKATYEYPENATPEELASLDQSTSNELNQIKSYLTELQRRKTELESKEILRSQADKVKQAHQALNAALVSFLSYDLNLGLPPEQQKAVGAVRPGSELDAVGLLGDPWTTEDTQNAELFLDKMEKLRQIVDSQQPRAVQRLNEYDLNLNDIHLNNRENGQLDLDAAIDSVEKVKSEKLQQLTTEAAKLKAQSKIIEYHQQKYQALVSAVDSFAASLFEYQAKADELAGYQDVMSPRDSRELSQRLSKTDQQVAQWAESLLKNQLNTYPTHRRPEDAIRTFQFNLLQRRSSTPALDSISQQVATSLATLERNTQTVTTAVEQRIQELAYDFAKKSPQTSNERAQDSDLTALREKNRQLHEMLKTLEQPVLDAWPRNEGDSSFESVDPARASQEIVKGLSSIPGDLGTLVSAAELQTIAPRVEAFLKEALDAEADQRVEIPVSPDGSLTLKIRKDRSSANLIKVSLDGVKQDQIPSKQDGHIYLTLYLDTRSQPRALVPSPGMLHDSGDLHFQIETRERNLITQQAQELLKIRNAA